MSLRWYSTVTSIEAEDICIDVVSLKQWSTMGTISFLDECFNSNFVREIQLATVTPRVIRSRILAWVHSDLSRRRLHHDGLLRLIILHRHNTPIVTTNSERNTAFETAHVEQRLKSVWTKRVSWSLFRLLLLLLLKQCVSYGVATSPSIDYVQDSTATVRQQCAKHGVLFWWRRLMSFVDQNRLTLRKHQENKHGLILLSL